jgi:lysophospholipase L1-like esterase
MTLFVYNYLCIMKKLLTILFVFIATGVFAQKQWVGTWATAPQMTTESNMPKANLNGCSVRQIVHVSLGGDVMRLQLSNEYGDTPMQIKSVFIADALDSCTINTKTARYLTFGKKHNVEIAAGKAVMSDAVKYHLKALQRLSITICFGNVPNKITSHPGSRTTSYIIEGEAKIRSPFATGEHIDHWFGISAIDVMAENADCIAVLGNSITDGRGSTTNHQDRWTDALAEALKAKGKPMGVLNLGIGGNCVLFGGLGDPALKRFDRDIMAQRGVKKLIVFEGVNDIGGSKGNSETIAKQLIEAYKTFIAKAHEHGMKVYGATITPFNNHYYYTFFHEAARQTVNEWIRTSKELDGVIDFDQLVRDPQDASRLQKDLQQDWLHPNAAGYKIMGEYAAGIVMK